MAFTGGASAVVGQVMNVIQAQANVSTTQLTAAVQRALTLAAQRVSFQRPNSLQASTPEGLPLLPEAPELGGNEADSIVARLESSFSQLLAEHFPGAETYTAHAETWINRALTTGGTGISAPLETQVWERERNRTLKESARASDEAATAWAARGYSMPPGALLHAQALIEQTAQEKLGESSRERAVKSIEAELENVRLAMNKAIDTRTAAVNAAVEYVRVTVNADSIDLQKKQLVQQAYTTLVNALLESYRASLSGADLALRAGIAQQQTDLEVLKTEAQLFAQNIQQSVQAAAAAVQAYAQMAGSALNGLHAQAAISGSDQTSYSESTITNL